MKYQYQKYAPIIREYLQNIPQDVVMITAGVTAFVIVSFTKGEFYSLQVIASLVLLVAIAGKTLSHHLWEVFPKMSDMLQLDHKTMVQSIQKSQKWLAWILAAVTFFFLCGMRHFFFANKPLIMSMACGGLFFTSILGSVIFFYLKQKNLENVTLFVKDVEILQIQIRLHLEKNLALAKVLHKNPIFFKDGALNIARIAVLFQNKSSFMKLVEKIRLHQGELIAQKETLRLLQQIRTETLFTFASDEHCSHILTLIIKYQGDEKRATQEYIARMRATTTLERIAIFFRSIRNSLENVSSMVLARN